MKRKARNRMKCLAFVHVPVEKNLVVGIIKLEEKLGIAVVEIEPTRETIIKAKI